MSAAFLSVHRVETTPSGGRAMIRLSTLSTVSVAALAALALACGHPLEPRTCQSDAECPSAAYCLTGVCIGGALPQANIRIAGSSTSLVSHRLVRFDGKGSIDPNPQHAVTGYRWAVKPSSAASCAPSTARGSDAELATVFECPGEYDVELTVKNSLGLESTPLTQGVSVARSTNPPVIQSQTPDLVFDHRCGGTPTVCAPVTEAGDGRFPLVVTATDVESGGALSYEWQVDPPPGADPAAVQFEPDRQSRTPTVRISGAAIAGEWIFRALVTDGDGLTTPAPVKVTVANQLPTIASDVAQLAFDHSYADNVYRAHGTVRLTIADPDGDRLLDPTVKLIETPRTGCLFAVPATVVQNGVAEVTLDLTCSRADELIGAVQRTIEATVQDSSGGAATVTLPFEVRDRPPTLAAAVVSMGHSVGPCLAGSCFVASGQLPLAVDPDGDPVSLVAVTPVGLDRAIWSSDVATGSFTLQTALTAPLSFRRADGTSPVSIVAHVTDPWQATDVKVALQITNRAPIATAFGATPPITYAGRAYLASGNVAQFVDEDGDPIDGVAGSGDASCGGFTVSGGAVAATCSVPFDWATGAYPALSNMVGRSFPVSVSVSDPWDRSGTVAAAVAPAAPPPPGPVASPLTRAVTCSCQCTTVDCQARAPCETVQYVPTTSYGLPLQVTLTRPDGTSTAVDCVNGTCSAPLPVTLCQASATLAVSIANGASSPLNQLVAASLTCANDPCAGVRPPRCTTSPCPITP
jgi:hypothetical protein